MELEDLIKPEVLDTCLKSDEKPEAEYFGLRDEDAVKRLEKFGPNALTEKKGLPWWAKFLL